MSNCFLNFSFSVILSVKWFEEWSSKSQDSRTLKETELDWILGNFCKYQTKFSKRNVLCKQDPDEVVN